MKWLLTCILIFERWNKLILKWNIVHVYLFAGGKQQTVPPSIPVSELFPDGNYPEGEIMKHPEINHDSCW
jgi:hypothetical protein